MSQIKITLFVICAIVGTSAASGVTSLKPKAAPAASEALDVYYHTPEGVTFAGMDSDGNFNGDYAFAAAGGWV